MERNSRPEETDMADLVRGRFAACLACFAALSDQ
jgi:hypothetical protein